MVKTKKVNKIEPKKYEVKFEKTEDGEVDKILNDKKQNYAQALKAYWQQVLTYKQAVLFQERFEKAIEEGKEVKDNFGLPMSRAELKLEAQKYFIQLRFIGADADYKLADIKETWNMTEEQVDKQAQDWFVGNEKIY